jgi:esterase/lipase
MSMSTLQRIVPIIVFACLSSFAIGEPNQRLARYTPRSADAAIIWQKEVRAKLFELLRLNDLVQAKSDIHFNAKELSSADKQTYRVREMEINSTPNRRIRIILTVPISKNTPSPAVVCIGGHGSNLHSPYDTTTIVGKDQRMKRDGIYKGFGTVLASMGYVTISTTVSQHEVYEKGRLLMAERLWDLIRCVDYLQSLPEVDDSRIGCAGLSLGGEMAMWLGAMDERIAATVSAGFLTTMDHMEQNHCMCWKFEGLRDLVDFADIYSLVAPRPLQCQNGKLEPESQFYVPLARQAMEEVRLTYKDLKRPENVILDVHDEGHVIDLPGLIYFFEKHLYQNRWKQMK